MFTTARVFGPLLFFGCLVAGCFSTVRPEPAVARHAPAPTLAANSPCVENGERPSRSGFFHELLLAGPTARTPYFDDYTEGSYHIDKMDLARGLPATAASCGLRLRAVLVVGPVGILWSYYVATLIEDAQGVRLNSLVMPHARITGKGSAIISSSLAFARLRDIELSTLVRVGEPPAPAPEDNAEFSYRLLLATYDVSGPHFFHADFNEFEQSPAVSNLLERVNQLLSETQKTYRVGDIKRKQ